MSKEAKTVVEYIASQPEDRVEALQKLSALAQKHLPKGFEEGMLYKMIGFYVPLKTYAAGYHCAKKEPEPLPFLNIASQKNFIALYHMGLYANQDLYNWFVAAYPKHCKYKLDMGKSCIRFKKMEDIPYDLIAELFEKISVEEWIKLYEDRYIKN